MQIISIASVGIVAVAKQGMISASARTTLVAMAVLCFTASRLLSHFIYKNFDFHDYNHAFSLDSVFPFLHYRYVIYDDYYLCIYGYEKQLDELLS